MGRSLANSNRQGSEISERRQGEPMNGGPPCAYIPGDTLGINLPSLGHLMT
jgi:hypothetical protein